MNRSNIFHLFLFSGLLLLSCNKEQSKDSFVPSNTELTIFDNYLNTLSTELKIPSLSVALVNDKEILWQKSYGYSDIDKKTKASENTAYDIGAIKNTFLSIMLLQLAEKHKLDINDSISKYLANLKHNKDIPIKYLTSNNISDYLSENTYDDNYKLLSEIISKVSDKDLSKLMKRKLFNKINLDNTFILNKTSSITDLNESFHIALPYSFDIASKINKLLLLDSIKMNPKDVIFSSTKDIAKFMIALDNNKLFRKNNTKEDIFKYLYYHDRVLPLGLGWNFQLYKTGIAWNYGCEKGYSSLLVKIPSSNISLIVLSNSEALNQPFDLDELNILNSPIATTFIKLIFNRMDTLPFLKFNQSSEEIKTMILKMKQTDYRALYYKELASYVKMYKYIGNSDKFTKYANLYDSVFPNDISAYFLTKHSITKIDQIIDQKEIKKKFIIQKDSSVVHIYAIGKGVGPINSWEYDNIEVYFDMKNRKLPDFSRDDGDWQYRFNYNSKTITGNINNTTGNNVIFSQYDPSQTQYVFEVKFPWKTLGHIKPTKGSKIGFDMVAADNDGGYQRKTIKAWHMNSNIGYRNTSVYGCLTLLNDNKNLHPNDSVYYSAFTNIEPIIDGKSDSIWEKQLSYNLEKTVSGDSRDNNDFSVSYKTMWNDKNLYVLVTVNDNFKSEYKLYFPINYGQIENLKTGDVVWQMDLKYSNYMTYSKINLKAGEYILHYICNDNNYSPSDEKQKLSFYGIVLF